MGDSEAEGVEDSAGEEVTVPVDVEPVQKKRKKR